MENYRKTSVVSANFCSLWLKCNQSCTSFRIFFWKPEYLKQFLSKLPQNKFAKIVSCLRCLHLCKTELYKVSLITPTISWKMKKFLKIKTTNACPGNNLPLLIINKVIWLVSRFISEGLLLYTNCSFLIAKEFVKFLTKGLTYDFV